MESVCAREDSGSAMLSKRVDILDLTASSTVIRTLIHTTSPIDTLLLPVGSDARFTFARPEIQDVFDSEVGSG